MTTMTFYARGDSSTANNSALNAQGTSKTPTTELVFESTIGGDIVLDYHNGDPDPTTVVYVDGVERSFFVEFSGTLPHTNKLSNVNGEDLRGQEIVVITTDDGQRYFFLTNGTTSFVTMDAFPNGAHSIENFTTNTDVYICFVAGTLIATPRGNVPVERLRAGDLVLTASGEAVPALWTSRRTVSVAEQIFRPESRPVCIPRGSFGPGKPHRALHVSQMHRVLVRDQQAELLFGRNEVFVHAGHLPADRARAAVQITGPVTYHHILLERHQVLLSNGLETESLFPGDVATASLTESARAAMVRVLVTAGLQAGDPPETARPSLRSWEANLLFACIEPNAGSARTRQAKAMCVAAG